MDKPFSNLPELKDWDYEKWQVFLQTNVDYKLDRFDLNTIFKDINALNANVRAIKDAINAQNEQIDGLQREIQAIAGTTDPEGKPSACILCGTCLREGCNVRGTNPDGPTCKLWINGTAKAPAPEPKPCEMCTDIQGAIIAGKCRSRIPEAKKLEACDPLPRILYLKVRNGIDGVPGLFTVTNKGLHKICEVGDIYNAADLRTMDEDVPSCDKCGQLHGLPTYPYLDDWQKIVAERDKLIKTIEIEKQARYDLEGALEVAKKETAAANFVLGRVTKECGEYGYYRQPASYT